MWKLCDYSRVARVFLLIMHNYASISRVFEEICENYAIIRKKITHDARAAMAINRTRHLTGRMRFTCAIASHTPLFYGLRNHTGTHFS